MSWEDPIVAEVRRVREKLSAEFSFDLRAIVADVRALQDSAGDRLVRLQHADRHKKSGARSLTEE